MKKFFFFAAALFAAVSFAACSDDDDENAGSGGAGGNGRPSYYVSQIDFGDPYYNHVFNYEYDGQNRLIKIIEDEGKGNITTFYYVTNHVKCVCSDSSYNRSFFLNDKGYVQKEGDYATFEYDSDGYLLKMKYSDDDIICYTWKDGDMIEYGRDGVRNIKFTYYDDINKINFDPSQIFMFGDDMFLDTIVPYFAGRKSKHLLKSITDESVDATFEYELDTKGRPTTILGVRKDKYGTYEYEYNYKLSYK